MCIGHGYDLHRLDGPPPDGAGKPFVLGGVRLECDRGPVGHSDGDALLHAITDAILGALGEPDLGTTFPDSDQNNRDRDSREFLEHALSRMASRGCSIEHLDATIICEQPKISPSRDAIIDNLARLMNCQRNRINIKGKTHEGVDAIGEGRAIEVHVVILLED